METGKAIYKLLKDSADVGAICADRIYPELAQQDVDVPFIVYTVTDTTPSGTKNATSKLDTARVELYCVSDDYEQSMDLGIACRSALDRQSGTVSGVEVQSIDFDTSDVQFDPDQRVYVLEQTYDVRIQRTGTAQVVSQFPGNTFTVEEVDGTPSGAVNKLVFSNGTVTIDGNTATVVSGGGAAGDSYHGRYDTQAEAERAGATGNVEYYYTARPDGDGEAESETSDTGETDTINRTLAYSTKFRADPDTAADWTDYTTQPADNASFATAKAALLAGLNETDATAETRGTLPLSLKMTRTTTAASSDLLLDTYTGAAAAYSVRKLSKDYTGSCMRVRRSSDEATQDIGFDSNGDLDTSALATFVGDAYGYCTILYDQSGNGNNATQSTSSQQPMIYDRVAAAVVTENSVPAIKFDGSDDGLLTSAVSQSFDYASVFVAYRSTATNQQNIVRYRANGAIGTVDGWSYEQASNAQYGGNTFIEAGGNAVGASQLNEGGAPNTSQQLKSLLYQQSQVLVYEDGTLDTTLNTVRSGSTPIGTASPNEEFWLAKNFDSNDRELSGTMQEVIIYHSDQSTNRSGIETNINNYFSIYT
jgi:hypothetical protein